MSDESSIVAGASESRGELTTASELALLAVVVLAGLWLRASDAERISVEHFDEGVYASNWYCRPPGLPDGVFPRQYLYAPPLLPNLCYWWLFFSGSDPHAVVWINIATGTLMIPLLWWMGRTWFGPTSGFLAAALCAFSDLHVALSRMVLTDVLLSLFMTAGVWTGVRALQTGRVLWIVLGGVLTSLAWWTKYNGWLTLAITGAGLAGWVGFHRPHDQSIGRLLLRWLVMAAIAFALWSPVLWGLQDHGGYSAVAENHARYIVGLTGWWDSLQSQVLKWRHLENWLSLGLTAAALAVAYLVIWPVPKGPRVQARASWLIGALIVMGVTLSLAISLGGMVIACGLLGLAAIVRDLWLSREATNEDDVHQQRSALPRWTTLAWFAGLLLATPMYTPYPRLALPLMVSIWLMASTVWYAHRHRKPSDSLRPQQFGQAIMLLLGCGVLISTVFPEQMQATPYAGWGDRRGLESLAPEIVNAAQADFISNPTAGHEQVKTALYVFAEPGMFYHLAALKQHADFRFFAQPIGDHGLLEHGSPHPKLATFIITGPHADASESDTQRFAAAVAAGQLTLVREFLYAASDLVLLDQTDPDGLSDFRRQTVRLYRLTE